MLFAPWTEFLFLAKLLDMTNTGGGKPGTRNCASGMAGTTGYGKPSTRDGKRGTRDGASGTTGYVWLRGR